MPYHDELPFISLHKAKINSGTLASRPASPDGLGDVYWAPDANSGAGGLYLTNLTGTSWAEFVSGVPDLVDLGDVNITTPSNGSALIWDSGTSKWIDGVISSTLSDLSDVNTSGIQDGYVLIWDAVGSEWIVTQRVTTISSLTDVDTITQQKGDIIVSNGTLFQKVAVGTNNQVLTADSSTSQGVKWSTFSADFDVILTDGNDVLIDDDGNVLTEI